MQEVTDCIHPRSPEELAIHFLMRHTACRRALIEQADSEFPHRATLDPAHEAIADARTCAGAGAQVIPAAEATKHDSCAARFSKAYAAARHTSTSRGA